LARQTNIHKFESKTKTKAKIKTRRTERRRTKTKATQHSKNQEETGRQERESACNSIKFEQENIRQENKHKTKVTLGKTDKHTSSKAKPKPR
jgi:hypothetical protein